MHILTPSPGLTTNADGSLTLYLQYAPPTEAVQQANWLPVAAGQFYLVIRSYDPSPDIISGKWAPPPVLKTAPYCVGNSGTENHPPVDRSARG
ncbi:MAG TPA: DUF1214 domain-containing protein [Coleofasciculaceae cyanobacterium]